MDNNISKFSEEFSIFQSLIKYTAEKEKGKVRNKTIDEDRKTFELWDKLDDDILEFSIDLFYADTHFKYTKHHENNFMIKFLKMNDYLRKMESRSIFELMGEIDCLLTSPKVKESIDFYKDENDYENYYYNYLPSNVELTPQNVFRCLVKNNFGLELYSPEVGDVYTVYNPQTLTREKRKVTEVNISGVRNEKMVLTAAWYKTSLQNKFSKYSQMGEDE